MTDPPPKQHPLQELRAHLHSAHDAAQRLMQQATQTPSWGWESDEAAHATGAADQARALSELLHSLRELLPEDVRAQLAELIRALLEVLLALLELLRQRLSGSEPRQSAKIRDIPI